MAHWECPIQNQIKWCRSHGIYITYHDWSIQVRQSHRCKCLADLWIQYTAVSCFWKPLGRPSISVAIWHRFPKSLICTFSNFLDSLPSKVVCHHAIAYQCVTTEPIGGVVCVPITQARNVRKLFIFISFPFSRLKIWWESCKFIVIL